jgi:1-acyl-sn-glycerol-3-phosphate acyltransferase
MIYYVLRAYCQLVLLFLIKKIRIEGLSKMRKSGPVMIASNHPNSFLDAIIINCLVTRPVWSLARGDAFKNSFARKFLSKIYMMPIYRISEGKEYLGKNDETFAKCYEIFKNDGVVLIFSEGLCTNQTELLPLKKGTGRLAQQTWETGLDLKIVPMALSYDQYKSFGKKVSLVVDEAYGEEVIEKNSQEGFFLKAFNQVLSDKLRPMLTRVFDTHSFKYNPFYYLGWLLHFPLYGLGIAIISQKTKKSVFFDSFMFGFLILSLPLYWLLLFFLANFLC